MQSYSLLTKLGLAALLVFVGSRIPSTIFATPVAEATAPTTIPTTLMDPTIGEIRLFAGNFAPRGWAFCDGRLLPINSNQALFSILGTIYGGDGRTTFALPDLRGRVPVHPGQGPGLPDVRLGWRFGQPSVRLTPNQLPAHSHDATVAIRAGRSDGDLKSDPTDRILASAGRGGAPVYTSAQAAMSLRNDATEVTVGNTGQGAEINLHQPSLGVNYIIALQGVYPSRN